MVAHVSAASSVTIPGSDLPQAATRLVETPEGQVIGFNLRWDGGQCCALLARGGMVTSDDFPFAIDAPLGLPVAVARGSAERLLLEPEDLLDASIIAVGTPAAGFGVRVGDTGREAIGKLHRGDEDPPFGLTIGGEGFFRAHVRSEDAGAEYTAVRAHLRRTSPRQEAPLLEISQIVAWADAHHARTGEWPRRDSGVIAEAPRETWIKVDAALRLGLRGLPAGWSLARLLTHYRGVRNRKALPPYTEPQILAWADAHHRRTGRWPTAHEGPIEDAPGETWTAVGVALVKGLRGLPGGSSLAQLLAEHRARRNRRRIPLLSEDQILAWADAHRERTGEWPVIDGGPIEDAPGETWCGINHALNRGTRGLPGGTSLTRLLAARRGARHRLHPPPLCETQILVWADAHFARTGNWPTGESGAIREAPEETWATVDALLRDGRRGLPGGSSLVRLLREHRGRENPRKLPSLQPEQILAWADAHHARTGQWPRRGSGPIADQPDTTWMAVNIALSQGKRGLPGGSSLTRFLAVHRGIIHRTERSELTEAQILAWADAHRRRTGQWPTSHSGPILECPDDTWNAINKALSVGRRGLPGGSSLAQLLARAWGLRPHTRPRRTRPGKPRLPMLTVEQILAWADTHHARTGHWPTADAGAIAEDPCIRWDQVDVALRQGLRGLSGGSSLPRLLHERRGVRNRKALPPYSEAQILAWADAHRARTGRWPRSASGPIPEAPGETWNAVACALRNGIRGLSGGSSLRLLIERERTDPD